MKDYQVQTHMEGEKTLQLLENEKKEDLAVRSKLIDKKNELRQQLEGERKLKE